MIVIKANPGRVEEVSFTGMSAAERAIEAAVYQAIAPMLERVDRRLRTLNAAVLAALVRERSERTQR